MYIQIIKFDSWVPYAHTTLFCVRTENCYVVVLVDKEYIVSPVREQKFCVVVLKYELIV